MKEVSLAAIAAKLEKIDLWQIYFDTQAGAFVEFLEEYDEEASPEMTEEQILQYAFEVEDNWERYVPLPNAYDIDEHSIMKNFALQQEDLAIKEKLLEALNYGLSFPNTYMEMPFHDPNWQLVRVKGSKKAFLWTYEKDGVLHLNVKTDPAWREKLAAVNAHIRSMPYVIDLEPYFYDAQGFLATEYAADGLHPDIEGKQLMAQIINMHKDMLRK